MFVAILVLLGTGSSLWIGIQAYRQHAAVHEIEQLGGTIIEWHPRGPEWLRERVGYERMGPFDEVLEVRVDLHILDTDATNAVLGHMGRLTELQRLDLTETQVTDASLTHLKGLASVVSQSDGVLSSTARARRYFSRIRSAGAVQTKGRGFSLLWSTNSRIVSISSSTLLKLSRRMRFSLISRNQRSTRLSHELLVGMKCM